MRFADHAIIIDSPHGRIAVPWCPGDTADKLEERFEQRVGSWLDSEYVMRIIVREEFLERLDEFRKRGVNSLELLVTALEVED